MQTSPSFILLAAAALLYFVTAAFLLFTVIDSRSNPLRQSRRFASHWRRDDLFWCSIAAFLGLVGIYRVTGLEYLLQSSLRLQLRLDHLYVMRTEFQAPLAVAALVGGVILFALLDWRLRRRHPAIRVAAALSLVILQLLVLRAISLHALDAMLQVSIAGIRAGWVMELGLLGGLVFSAQRFRQWRASLSQRVRE